MASYKDAMGRDWTVGLDGPLIRAIRTDCGIDPISGEAYERLYDDPLLLADVLAIACRDQIQTTGITADQFRAAVRGDAIDSATKAFHEAQLDFSPSRQREMLRAAADKIQATRNKAYEKMLAQLASPEFEAKLNDALDKRQEAAMQQALTLLSSGMNLPELSESLGVVPSES